ncbi:DUF5615 family PIN-like protein [Litoribacter populi]|uniref:DUF5615 family PIN-like protein n=1 Tax=Litoribacter populi TaxID=2598460 RepID=UPI00117D6B0E|nr:DUF5615 family PIN-like protein [Litoribacter populi]
MKLLLDQNISYRIIEKLSSEFHEVLQVQTCGLIHATDLEIWQYASIHGLSIVTFDADFFELASLKGHPPKIIWLRCDNRTTKHLAQLLNSKAQIIKDFIQLSEYANLACLEIH